MYVLINKQLISYRNCFDILSRLYQRRSLKTFSDLKYLHQQRVAASYGVERVWLTASGEQGQNQLYRVLQGVFCLRSRAAGNMPCRHEGEYRYSCTHGFTVNLGTMLGRVANATRSTLGKGPCYRLFTKLSGPWGLSLDDAAYSQCTHGVTQLWDFAIQIKSKIVTTTDVWISTYSILTFYAYCNFNKIFIFYLITDGHHNFNIAYNYRHHFYHSGTTTSNTCCSWLPENGHILWPKRV